MQPHRQFDRILEICKSFSLDFLNSYGNLQHCGRKPRCADVEIIALSLFQEFLSIDSECLFFDTLQSILPDLAIRVGSRRNYNAHASIYYIALCHPTIRWGSVCFFERPHGSAADAATPWATICRPHLCGL